ncbi:hypothetical protein B0T17DRAFT_647202 [Bombardia bombarda]|uniref:DUF3669 domain-containing protein n=1 Tax=Bombardia bombarda TaxID=252184 RepID=A0AA39WH83_9PEZI|nr:hypothetical protein B0T17DRAFT_647202 [Bombardia bombarda]
MSQEDSDEGGSWILADKGESLIAVSDDDEINMSPDFGPDDIWEDEPSPESSQDDLAAESPEQCLKRLLTLQPTLKPPSEPLPKFHDIAHGTNTTIYAHPGTTLAYKVPNPRSRNSARNLASKLWNNYIVQLRVNASFQSLPYHLSPTTTTTTTTTPVEIPHVHWFSRPDDASFWTTHLSRFPATISSPHHQPVTARRPLLCMERIPALPSPVRLALIHKFYPPSIQPTVAAAPGNQDACVVRPVLGGCYPAGMEDHVYDTSLRNFPLYANQLRDLGLELADIYTPMAHALAVLHWDTRVNASGVEFILAGAPSRSAGVRTGGAAAYDAGLARYMMARGEEARKWGFGQRPEKHKDKCRYDGASFSTYEEATHADVAGRQATALWMVGFDECRNIAMNVGGVQMAVEAFLQTNYCCPRPGGGDDMRTMWLAFERSYVEFSDDILKYAEDVDDVKAKRMLPRYFVNKVAEAIEKTNQPEGGLR